MEFFAEVRRCVYVEGLSERAAARRFGLARETVRKMLRYRLPPGYRRTQPIRCPKLDGFMGIIDQILRDDQHRPKKQRHTAKRICERLRAEHAFRGGYTIIKDYVREKRLGGQEMFVPLVHPPGDAQADFGAALVVVDGVERKAHYLVVDLPHSDDAFVKAFPAETTEAFCEGHNAAFHYFGGVPRGIVYDNTKLAVARILGDGTRQRTQVFSELRACCSIHAPPGCGWIPAMVTRRDLSSITKKTRYRLSPASVNTSTVNRSQAARPSQCACRNVFQGMCRLRSGAGGRCCAVRKLTRNAPYLQTR